MHVAFGKGAKARRICLSITLTLSLMLVVAGCSMDAMAAKSDSAADWSQYVNPFIGTARGSGSTYPGAQLPFGMLSFSPHSTVRNHGSGYDRTCDQIRGFGLVHISGVGCEAVCELPFLPVTGSLEQSPVKDKNVYSSTFRKEAESASPGYYSVMLDRYNVNTELSATTRCGIARFEYPSSDSAHVIFDPTASANGMRDGKIDIDANARIITGWVRGGGFCHQKKCDYLIHFVVEFDSAVSEYGIWKGEENMPGAKTAEGKDIAAYVSFDTDKVIMKTGISYVSLENAKENLATEIPGWGFDAVKAAARKEWNKTLDKVQIEGGSVDDKTIFYTALYHSVVLPNIYDDVNGEYMGMDEKVYKVKPGHHAYSTFSGWDTYRTQAQLWGLLYPEAGSDFCQTMLETSKQTEYKGGGGLPLWSMFNDETLIMAGYPAAPFIASAYAFGARDFDVEALTNVMTDSGLNNRYWGRNLHYTWGCLPEYKKYGYYGIDFNIHCPVSQNVEYVAADFSIAQMAKEIGDEENYNYFLKRSQSAFNILHPEKKYLWGRFKDGSWKEDFNPFSNDGCQEGTSTHYTWGISHNLGRLINEIGGNEAAQERLDKLMSEIATGYDYGNPKYLAGNEPCFGIVPVYNWMGAPWKAQKQMRRVMDASFTNEVKGIPGDDDSGAMSAWYIFASLGLYPEIPGVGGFSVTGPLFPKVTLKLDNGKKIVITADNAAHDAPYITSMKLNGSSLQQTWLTVDQLTEGNVNKLEFEMATEPDTDWASSYIPPSYDVK